MRRNLPLYLAAALLALSLTPTAILAQSLGDSKVVAPVPLPGYPEGIATRGNRFYVSGPAAFGQPLGSAYAGDGERAIRDLAGVMREVLG